MTLADWLAVLTPIKEVVVTVAAVIGATVACRGLTTWQRQLRGQADFEVARKFLRAAYKLRAVILSARWGVVTPQEQSKAAQEFGVDPSDTKYRREVQDAVYMRRWNSIVAANIEFEAERIEVQVLWGEPAKVAGAAFEDIITDFVLATQHLVRDTKPNPDKEYIDARAVVSDSSGKGTDAMGLRITKAIAAIEEFVKPHLRV